MLATSKLRLTATYSIRSQHTFDTFTLLKIEHRPSMQKGDHRHSDEVTVGRSHCRTKSPSNEVTVERSHRQTKSPPNEVTAKRSHRRMTERSHLLSNQGKRVTRENRGKRPRENRGKRQTGAQTVSRAARSAASNFTSHRPTLQAHTFSRYETLAEPTSRLGAGGTRVAVFSINFHFGPHPIHLTAQPVPRILPLRLRIVARSRGRAARGSL